MGGSVGVDKSGGMRIMENTVPLTGVLNGSPHI